MAAEKKWLFTLFSAAFLSVLLFLSSISGFIFASSRQFPSLASYGTPYPPAFAYYIYGGGGHKDRILRLLLAVYHPRNRYLLHLQGDASDDERIQLALAVRSIPAVGAFANVDVLGKSDQITYMGASNIASTLHAAALLLKIDSGWDWFITLSSVDYPLLTPDAFPSILLFLSSISGFIFALSHQFPSLTSYGAPSPPAFAYYIYGGGGHKDRILRLLLAVYHPRNQYLLHLQANASDDERIQLALAVRSIPAVGAFANVDVLGKSNQITYMGASNIASTLHAAAALLLKIDSGWDWFITLSFFTPDDMAHVFSFVKRGLSFIDHTSDLGWKESQRVQPIVVDPGIYLARRHNQIFTATQKRPTPEAFKFFTGSPWVTLGRSFLEYCVLGWDNLPRTLLMYFTNVILSQEGYFHSVICNAPTFRNMTVNNDLRYIVWDNPPKMEPHFLNVTDYDHMVHSGAAFARQFQKDDPILDMVDHKILKRSRKRPAPGAWCTGRNSWWSDPCSKWGDINVVRPGPQAEKLRESMTRLLNDWKLGLNQCT